MTAYIPGGVTNNQRLFNRFRLVRFDLLFCSRQHLFIQVEAVVQHFKFPLGHVFNFFFVLNISRNNFNHHQMAQAASLIPTQINSRNS